MNRYLPGWMNRLITPHHPYENMLDDRRARTLMLVLVAGIILGLPYAVWILLNSLQQGALPGVGELILLSIPVLVFVSYRLVHRGYLRAASLLLWGLTLVAVMPGLADGATSTETLALVLPIVAGSVLLGWRITVLTVALETVAVAQYTLIQPGVDETAATIFAATMLILSIVALWTIAFSTNIQRAASSFIGEMADIREVVRLVTNTEGDEVTWILQAINLLRDRLGYSYAQVYLTEGDSIDRRITTGMDSTQPLIEHNVRLTENNAILNTVRSGQTLVIKQNSSLASRSHLLPGIQSAVVVPLVADNRVIGVLDIQQEDARPFSMIQIETLELMAGQLGNSIQKQRITDAMRVSLDDQNRIIQRQRERLDTYERAEVERTTSAWSAYLRQRGIDYMGFDLESGNLNRQPTYDVDDTLEPALRTGEINVQLDGDFQIVSVPILLRGRTLGAMSFKVPEGAQTIGPRQTDLIRSVVQRLALALENKRLFEQSQSQAQRESKANEVGSLLLSTTDIQTVLSLAANNFNDALGAIQTRIHIQPEAQGANEGRS